MIFALWRLCVLPLVLGALSVVAFPPAVVAQTVPAGAPDTPVTGGDRTDLVSCLNRRDLAGTEEDPDRSQGVGGFQTPQNFVDNAFRCAEAFAADVIIADYAVWYLYPLTIILIVWTGVTISFSGRFDITEVISTIFLIGFVYMLMGSFGGTAVNVTPIWGDNISFPRFLSSLARPIVEGMVQSTWEDISRAWNAGLFIFSAEALNAQSIETYCLGVRSAYEHSFGMYQDPRTCDAYEAAQGAKTAFTLVFLVYMAIAILLGAVPLLVAYFSYLWGFFSLIVATIVGPLLIPFGLVQQTSFLLWGWIRACVGATVQMLVGGVIFAICGTLLVTPLTRYTNQLGDMLGDAGSYTAGMAMTHGLAMVFEFLPLALIAALGAFKASELTSMILSGGAPPSSGLGARYAGARQAGGAARGIAGGARAVGGAATGAVTGAATGGVAAAAMLGRKALSQATKSGGG